MGQIGRIKPGANLGRKFQLVFNRAREDDAGGDVAEVAPRQQRLRLQPVQHGELVVAQLLVRVGLASAFDDHAISLPRPVLGAGQHAAVALEVGHDDGRRQDADQVDLCTVPHRVGNGNNPVRTVCPTIFQPLQKNLEHLVFVGAAGIFSVSEYGHWLFSMVLLIRKHLT